jgi:SAM-dependent methyltransferase
VPELAGELPGGLDRVDPALIHAFADLGAEHGPASAFEEICARYLDTHSRRLLATPRPVAELMTRLAETDGGTVLDPACGIGTLLLASGASRALGQDINETAARVTTVRLLLHGTPAVVRSGDTLRADAFPGELVDAVVCNPPFNDRGWGYEELASDPRWEHGLPPRGESELAWVQHCWSHLRPGGLAVVMMPGPAADRRAGRRVRGNLLRAGALRAIVTLSVGAAPASSGAPDLWVLCRPEPGDRPPSGVLMVNAGEDLEAAQAAWRMYRAGERLPDVARAVRIIDLLDEEIALIPARHVSGPSRPEPLAFSAVRERAASALAALDLPDLAPLAQPREPARTNVGELARAGAVTVLQAPLRMRAEGGGMPVLTVKDLLLDRAPSGRTDDEPGLVVIEPGDVIAPLIPREDMVARVMTRTGAVLGPQLLLLRPDPERLDPFFLAGCLRAVGETGVRPGSSGRVDPRRAQLPRLPIEEQRAYGETFRRLLAFEDAVREARTASETLVRLGFDGLLEGTLEPR